LPLGFIPHPDFCLAAADKMILTEMPAGDVPAKPARIPSALPPYLASLYDVPLLTRQQEGHLFRKYNYLKYQASKLRNQLDLAHPKLVLMKQIERLYDAALAVKNQIVRANLRLVVSIAKRYMDQGESFFELVSDGNMSLMRAVDKFDVARGNKISTYASWAIMQNFARSIPHEQRHRDRFRTCHEEMLGASHDYRLDSYEQENEQRQREAQVRKLMNRLDDREQKIVASRFGLGAGREPRTLGDIGEKMGVSKERVRQIEARAMKKLRIAAAEENIEVPGTS
jgi:RNA polymerase primary sigma factor/RNA polymerase sigma factor